VHFPSVANRFKVVVEICGLDFILRERRANEEKPTNFCVLMDLLYPYGCLSAKGL
jgi:hypothetical protein